MNIKRFLLTEGLLLLGIILLFFEIVVIILIIAISGNNALNESHQFNSSQGIFSIPIYQVFAIVFIFLTLILLLQFFFIKLIRREKLLFYNLIIRFSSLLTILPCFWIAFNVLNLFIGTSFYLIEIYIQGKPLAAPNWVFILLRIYYDNFYSFLLIFTTLIFTLLISLYSRLKKYI